MRYTAVALFGEALRNDVEKVWTKVSNERDALTDHVPTAMAEKPTWYGRENALDHTCLGLWGDPIGAGDTYPPHLVDEASHGVPLDPEKVRKWVNAFHMALVCLKTAYRHRTSLTPKEVKEDPVKTVDTPKKRDWKWLRDDRNMEGTRRRIRSLHLIVNVTRRT